MDALVLAAQMLLAGVFAVAGTAKLLDRPGARQALTEFGLPARWAGPGALGLPLAELLIAVGLLLEPTVRAGAVAALLLLLGFAAAIGVALARGQTPDCHCFGQIHSAPAGRGTLGRNVALAALALLVAVRGPGESLHDVLAGRDAAELTAIATGSAALVLAAAVWRLWRDNRRLALDLSKVRAVAELLPPGLPVGTRAPDFTLRGLRGETLTLDSLRGRGRPVAVVFADPFCGPCRRLLPAIGRWQAALADRLTIVVISTGSLLENRATAQEHGVADLLVQERTEVMDAYHVDRTPTALIVSGDGYVASAPAAAEFEIEELIRLTLERSAEASWSDTTY